MDNQEEAKKKAGELLLSLDQSKPSYILQVTFFYMERF